MDLKQDLIHYHHHTVPSSAQPVERYFKLTKAGEKIIKKTITNKLGQKRVIWVKEQDNG